MKNIELTTMCAIVKQDKVLMINRKKSWKGWSFPGGHLEEGESILDCVTREIKEETGFFARKLKYKGKAHFYNPETKKRHIIENYLCDDYEGQLVESCDEGNLEWIRIEDILKLDLAEGMQYRLPLFFESGVKELYVEWDKENGYTRVLYQEV